MCKRFVVWRHEHQRALRRFATAREAKRYAKQASHDREISLYVDDDCHPDTRKPEPIATFHSGIAARIW